MLTKLYLEWQLLHSKDGEKLDTWLVLSAIANNNKSCDIILCWASCVRNSSTLGFLFIRLRPTDLKDRVTKDTACIVVEFHKITSRPRCAPFPVPLRFSSISTASRPPPAPFSLTLHALGTATRRRKHDWVLYY
jgi:hypothetical protein